MKSIVSIMLIFALTNCMVKGLVPVNLTEEQIAKVRHLAVECMEKEKTTKEAVEAFTKGQFTSADRSLKCYANCFLHNTGYFVDGVLQTSMINSKLGPAIGEEKLKKIMEACSGLKGADNCETAFMLLTCYHKEHADIA